MDLKAECRMGKFDLICEHCNKKVMSDIIVSDNGQPFLQVRCGTCDNTEEFELDPDCWPELPSKLK